MKTPLKDMRLSRGVKRGWLAEQLGIHPKTLENYENGKTKAPKTVLYMSADLLHCNLSQISDDR